MRVGTKERVIERPRLKLLIAVISRLYVIDTTNGAWFLPFNSSKSGGNDRAETGCFPIFLFCFTNFMISLLFCIEAKANVLSLIAGGSAQNIQDSKNYISEN